MLINVSLLHTWLDRLYTSRLLTNHLFLRFVSLRNEHCMSQNSFLHHSAVVEAMLPFVNGFLASPSFKLLFSMIALNVARESCVVFFAHDFLTGSALLRAVIVSATPRFHLDLFETMAALEQSTIMCVLVCVVACSRNKRCFCYYSS